LWSRSCSCHNLKIWWARMHSWPNTLLTRYKATLTPRTFKRQSRRWCKW
jgi:hypothetical protein